MKKVLLHVGHGKTGTSYIQSFLAINGEKLPAYNIWYPNHTSFEDAKRGYVTSGNMDSLERFDDYILEHVAVSEFDNVLFSSEFLFELISRNRDAFARICKYFDVVVILFIRDPFEHAISTYGQLVKAGRLTVSVHEYMNKYKTPWVVSDLIDIVREAGASLVVKNYSNHRRCILRAFLPALHLEERNFTLPLVQDINRSLSPNEIRVQIAFNRYFGKQAYNFVARPLINNIPLSPKFDLTTTRETCSMFFERMADIVPSVNRKLPDGELYSLNGPTHFSDQSDTGNFIYLSDRQIDLIASSVHAYIRKLETRNELLCSRSKSPYRRICRLFNKDERKRKIDEKNS
jgi:hypothetical protein